MTVEYYISTAMSCTSPSPVGTGEIIHPQHLILSLSKDEVLVARILRQAQDEDLFSPHPPAGPKPFGGA
jgi:hypothetical protein